eukprot:gene5420-5653_t
MSESLENGKTKARKPYTITKTRERWSEEEHMRFVEALRLHGRAWRKIEEHIGTKTAVQIRSHAQKFFNKLEKKKEAGEAPEKEEDISIPPPRPKRKPAKLLFSRVLCNNEGGLDRTLLEATGTTDGTHVSANAQLRGSDGDRLHEGLGSSNGCDSAAAAAELAAAGAATSAAAMNQRYSGGNGAAAGGGGNATRTKSRRAAPSGNSGSSGPPVGSKRSAGEVAGSQPAKKPAREASGTNEEAERMEVVEALEAPPRSPSIQEKELKAASQPSQPSNTNGNTSGSNESNGGSNRRQGTAQAEGSHPAHYSSGNGYSVRDSNTGTNTNGHTNGNGHSSGEGLQADFFSNLSCV